MVSFDLKLLKLMFTIFYESYCLLFLMAIREIKISPNTINVIRGFNVFCYTNFRANSITCSKLIQTLSLENNKCSISYFLIIYFCVCAQTRDKVPIKIFSFLQIFWIGNKESEPVTITIFC